MSTSNLQKRFSQAYVLGGSPCSGKSTIAEMLSVHYSFHYYKADDHESEHMQRARSPQQPVMYQYSKMGWDAILTQSAEKLCADELAYYYERFPFMLKDLKQLTSEKPLLLEGAAFLPRLLYEYSVKPEKAVFMVPTFEFQVKYYSQRPFIHSILKDCHDPKQAFENWMKRDHLFGLEIIRQAKRYGYPALVVDGSVTIPEQLEKIKTQFKL